MGRHRKQSRFRKHAVALPVIAMCAGLVTSASHQSGVRSLSDTMPTLEPIHHTAPIAIPTSWETFTYAEGEAIPHITHSVTVASGVTPQSHEAHVKHEEVLASREQTPAPTLTGTATPSAPVIPRVSGSRLQEVVQAAESQIGVPYVYGGESHGADFDCSGLTQWAYSMAGVSIPRIADDQFRAFTMIPQSQAEPGDLVFFHDSSDPFSYVYHVGIYLGGADMMVVAPDAGQNVQIQSFDWGGNTVTFGALT
jgi:cell wall-associated NlpC family hydrolase